MKNNTLKIVKIASLAASVIGMIGSAWVTGKENEATLKRLVEESLKK